MHRSHLQTSLIVKATRRLQSARSTIPSQSNSPLRTGVLLTWRRPYPPRWSRRTFITDALPSVLVPPVVFVGLVVALWSWKCLMMVIFQDKIIYMPSIPPFARSEIVEDYERQCRPVQWSVKEIRSLDGTKLALCLGRMPDTSTEQPRKEMVICYFQGNGGSLPPRLPILSSVLKLLARNDVRYSVAALSYRGYWQSSGRATQSEIELDVRALLDFVLQTYGLANVEVVLWGQSIGAGVATFAGTQAQRSGLRVSHLILETPFTSIRSMLAALYPQKWLPYKYLWPFLWNHWDSRQALTTIASSQIRPKILLLPGTRDEVVPPSEIDQLERLCGDLDLQYKRVDVAGALHTEVSVKRVGQEAIADFIARG